MLAKPSATSVPVLAIIIERLMLRRPWRSVALAAGPWLLITASFIAIGVLVQPTLGAVNVPVWARPLVAGDSLAFYLQKLCVPVRLAPRYPHSANAVVTSWQLKVAWLAPASLLAFCWGLRRGAPWLLAGTLIFFAAPLPVLGLVPFHYQRLSTVADRYVYVAMLGPSLVLAFALAAICQSKGCRPALRWAAGACTAALAVALASRSARQSRSWQNTELLCRRILALDPSNAPAYAALARDARENGRLAEAEGYARRAATLEPDSLDDELYLGQTLQAQDRQSDAAAVYRDAIRRHPNSANAWVSLADALANGGHPGPAIAMCRAAISLDSNNAVAHRDLAMLLVGQHENSQAVAEAAEAVRLEPSAAINHMIYGKTLAIAGRQAEADQQFAAAKALAPQGHGNRFGSN